MSSKFMKQFKLYLYNDLVKEYIEIIKNKMITLFEKWEKEYENNDKRILTINKIADFLRHNRNCKLPWTIKEIKTAIYVVDKSLKRFSCYEII